MSEFNWTCSYCQRAQTVTDSRRHFATGHIAVGETAHGYIAYSVFAIGCANPACKRPTIRFAYGPQKDRTHAYDSIELADVIDGAQFPKQLAKPQPDFIPKAIVQDYIEACAIIGESPKAAATLARRCLQGMIRDFCRVSKNKLIDEIGALMKMADDATLPAGVTIESVNAIDHVRLIGNIGAHMEKDINSIVEVDASEARTLIDLIESLFEDWYVERQQRVERFAKLGKIAAEKSAAKSQAS